MAPALPSRTLVDPRANRQAAVLAVLPDGVDALVVTHLPNIRWPDRLHPGSSRPCCSSPAIAARWSPIFDMRARRRARWGASAEVVIDRASVWDRLRRVLEASGFATIAVESHVMTIRDAERAEAKCFAVASCLQQTSSNGCDRSRTILKSQRLRAAAAPGD